MHVNLNAVVSITAKEQMFKSVQRREKSLETPAKLIALRGKEITQ